MDGFGLAVVALVAGATAATIGGHHLVQAVRQRSLDCVARELGDLAGTGVTLGRTEELDTCVDAGVAGLPLGFSVEPLAATGTAQALGDAAFDARFRVNIPRPHHLAWLDAKVRAAFVADPDRLEVAGGRLRKVAVPSVAGVRATVALAARLADREPAGALAAMAVADPVVGLRRRAAGALVGLDPARAASVRTDDPAAAAILVQDPEALEAAVRALPIREQAEVLGALRAAQQAPLLRAALAALGGARSDLGIPFAAAAEAVADLGDPNALRILLRLLDRASPELAPRWAWLAAPALATAPPDPELEARCAALAGDAGDRAGRLLGWLERHGTPASVPALRALEEGAPRLWGARDAARRARRAIQARTGLDRGGLSLAEPGAGELAVAAEADRGALTEPAVEEP